MHASPFSIECWVLEFIPISMLPFSPSFSSLTAVSYTLLCKERTKRSPYVTSHTTGWNRGSPHGHTLRQSQWLGRGKPTPTCGQWAGPATGGGDDSWHQSNGVCLCWRYVQNFFRESCVTIVHPFCLKRKKPCQPHLKAVIYNFSTGAMARRYSTCILCRRYKVQAQFRLSTTVNWIVAKVISGTISWKPRYRLWLKR